MRIDKDGTIIGANPAAKKVFSPDILRKSIYKKLPEIRRSFVQTLSPLKPEQLEVKIGKKMFLLTFSKEEQSERICIFSSDITETKNNAGAMAYIE